MLRPLILSLLLATTAYPQPITYRLERAYPLSQRTEGEIAILEKLNRADAAHLPRLKDLIIPDRFDAGELDYTALPRTISALAEHPKAIVVAQPQQLFGAYEKGELVRWGPVSSGRREFPTPAGRYHLNWRSPGRQWRRRAGISFWRAVSAPMNWAWPWAEAV